MEPRPQRPRPGQGRPQQPSGTPEGQAPRQGQGEGSSPRQDLEQNPELAGYPEGVDPTAFVAPPRTEYDYSPLDLAPSGQRRRRQFVAAAAGGLVVLLLVAVVMLAYLVLADDDPADDEDAQLAAQQDEVATLEAQLTAVAEEEVGAAMDNEDEAEDPAGTPAPEEEAEEAAGEADDAVEEDDPEAPSFALGENASTPDDEDEISAEDQEQASEEEEGEADNDSPSAAHIPQGDESVSADQLPDLLPGEEAVPEGLDVVEDSELDLETVVGSLGGGRNVEQMLEGWGWSGHAQRVFSAADPEVLAPDATATIVISIHAFEGEEAAQEALPFYSDVLLDNHVEVEEAPDVGDAARMLIQEQAEGGQSVSLYVQQGPVLYRFVGYSPAGDPAPSVIEAAEVALGGQ